ncbi:polyamine ABC transporter ATP-binding protein [Salinigranum rubrum]|uniref:Molybdate/tungstate import ATP-binding protein WtpC n=1 Tax=Salinigranum rubrum TaxID=755307 RepID=A0A2I8VN88_9EURY|nr:ABC transporter ATP-binding protein [Salinigranum rubrum]AUV83344.1 polyamine ABC transporter ATP-binding protein [Salinigranum rubrum]
MSLLSVRGLTKRFGDLTAVDGANFDVEDGEFVSILGPSGSGKSTILRMVAGFETPTEGEIVLAGENIVGTPPFERDINMVFQNLALFPHLTVAENIQYGLKQRGVQKDERERRTEEMLEMVRLPGYGPRDPSELSGGEQQRVALARALVNEPALVLFDEPLSSLDRKLRQHMQTELQRIQAETGITFLYVTHDQEVALSVSDRLVVLNDGLVEQVDSVEALYESPQSQFVADFIGDVNTVEARVVSAADDGLTIETGGTERFLPATNGFAAGDRIQVCVRPHDVTLSGDGDFAAPGTVRTRSYQGSDTVYTVGTDRWGDIVADVRGSDFDVGDSVTVAWDAADVHLFAVESEADDERADVEPEPREAT